MTTQLREAQFGHLVRFVTRRKLLRFPDEDDPSLWRTSLRQDPPSAPTDSAERDKILTESKGNRLTPNAAPEDSEAQDSKPKDRNTQHVVEGGNDAHIIDWYGPGDPEVTPSNPHQYTMPDAHIVHRTLRTGPANGKC
jgi:DHA1 family multidrug resistance protein-like MFS transporter